MQSTTTSADFVIVGSGIVGSCLAARLTQSLASRSDTGRTVILVDRDVAALPGSTGHAPGFVGQLNSLQPLTWLAKRTVEHYLSIPGAFDQCGSLEIGATSKAIGTLHDRQDLALEHDLPAEVISIDSAAQMAPDFVSSSSVTSEHQGAAALHFTKDGTANAKLIARHGQGIAVRHGAKLIDGDVTSIVPYGDDKEVTIELKNGQQIRVSSPNVILCTGIWAAQLWGQDLRAVVPVAHPYMYSRERPARGTKKSPFVRWPEKHVYARDHGSRDGIGSYDHAPIEEPAKALTHSAYGAWRSSFRGVLDEALQLLPLSTREQFDVEEGIKAAKAGPQEDPRSFNGVFAVTPDGMPLVGQLPRDAGMYCAVAVWVTHAAGVAHLLVKVLLGDELTDEETAVLESLQPSRFQDLDETKLRTSALGKYNDIYNAVVPGEVASEQ